MVGCLDTMGDDDEYVDDVDDDDEEDDEDEHEDKEEDIVDADDSDSHDVNYVDHHDVDEDHIEDDIDGLRMTDRRIAVSITMMLMKFRGAHLEDILAT